MENKFYAGAPFVLGADDKSSDAASLNTARLWQQPEYEGRAESGFRVAATAPLQFGDRLNRRNNFFFDRSEPAKLRIRNDGPHATQRSGWSCATSQTARSGRSG